MERERERDTALPSQGGYSSERERERERCMYAYI